MDGYRVMKRLGEGGFGQVVLAQARSTKRVSTGVFTISMRSWVDAQLVAIKTIKKRTPDYDRKIELLREEAAILSTLDHVHIIRLLEDDKAGPIDYFVMEYCPGGDLRGAIEDAKQRK
jgi:serine/threonine protein kinase